MVVVGLGERRAFVAKIACLVHCFFQRAGEDNFHRRCVFLDPVAQREATAGRRHISNDNFYSKFGRLQNGFSFVAGSSLQNFEAALTQIFRQRVTCDNVAFHQKDCLYGSHNNVPLLPCGGCKFQQSQCDFPDIVGLTHDIFEVLSVIEISGRDQHRQRGKLLPDEARELCSGAGTGQLVVGENNIHHGAAAGHTYPVGTEIATIEVGG